MRIYEEPLDTLPEDEVSRLLDHPDPQERLLALRLNSVRSHHLDRGALDLHPDVHNAAIDHPQFSDIEAFKLMEAKKDGGGNYPLAQQLAFLTRAERVRPAHISALIRNAYSTSPEVSQQALDAVVNHSALTDGHIRMLYRGYGSNHDQKKAILSRDNAPEDVLAHAVQMGTQITSPELEELARIAVKHPRIPVIILDELVRKADDSNPQLHTIAEVALESNRVSAGTGRYLFNQALLKPSPSTYALLGCYLRGPSATPEDIDWAIKEFPPTLWKGGLKSPAVTPENLDNAVAKAEGDKDLLKSISEHAQFSSRHLQQILAKGERDDNWRTASVIKEMFGFQPMLDEAFIAAQWLSGGGDVSPEAVRRCLYEEDGDHEKAALLAFGLEISEKNLDALRAVKQFNLQKSEASPETAESVVSLCSEGQDVAEAILRAYRDHFAFAIQLAGKHSKGAVIARDEQTKATWLLKPGSGDAGLAAGANEEMASQSAREAAWYHVAKLCGLENSYPRAELVAVDGREFAALRLIPWSFSSLEKRRKKEPGAARRILEPFRDNGVLHQWAVLDYVLGNGDRHGNNLMADNDGSVVLIDHGSAFAGDSFDPAFDKNSFIPYYLRAWAPEGNFNGLSGAEKLKYMPRVHESVANRIKLWILGISDDRIAAVCHDYGIDPQPTIKRLQKVRAAVLKCPADEAVNRLWVTT